MNIRLHHAAQVVGEATEALVSNGTTRERLLLASKILLGIQPREFDGFPLLQSRWDEIDARFSKVQDPKVGSYRRTVEKMSGPKMGELCELILSLDREIRTTE
ncbi:hypothetical protein I7I49_15300 [Sinorhizobium meliloti]|uniref:hypothetical protein n=1 Tax=Rhizobium meliloti TaxID=382 RepID=UPI00237F9883|nr:hypothetical protein [Sinorhizobium meliloti]MDE3811641.1 hypothetical protein [Sinorhizobium meliloti]